MKNAINLIENKYYSSLIFSPSNNLRNSYVCFTTQDYLAAIFGEQDFMLGNISGANQSSRANRANFNLDHWFNIEIGNFTINHL